MTNQWWRGEQLTVCHDTALGLRAVIAIHDTTLGPGLGGVRLGRYADMESAVQEAQRLAEAMTAKNALAGLPYGGAKSVIAADGPLSDRRGVMRRFGEFVFRTRGAYIPGVDMGTTPEDLEEMGATGARVSCADEDPSPWTAAGVFAALRTAAPMVLGRPDIVGVRVMIQGAGHVGARLADLVAAAGAQVQVADRDPERAKVVAERVDGQVIAAEDAVRTPTEVFAPCAQAGVVDRVVARTLPARLVLGAANDPLAEDACAALLAERSVVYVPDFVTNAGGVLQIHARNQGWHDTRLIAKIDGIGDHVREILQHTTRVRPALQVAHDLVAQILESGATSRSAPSSFPQVTQMGVGAVSVNRGAPLLEAQDLLEQAADSC